MTLGSGRKGLAYTRIRSESILAVLVAGMLSAGCAPLPAVPPAAEIAATTSTTVHAPGDVTAPAAGFADTNATQSLLAAIDERLTVMRDVAAAKWLAGTPILDAAREADVLQHVAARAGSLGLDPATTRAFFAEQVRLARDLQQHWHDEWSRVGRCVPCDKPPDLQAVRKRIDATNERQLTALYLLVPMRDDTVATVMEQMHAVLLRHQLATDDATAVTKAVRDVARITDGRVLDRVRATHMLRVGTTGDYAPFSLDTAGLLAGADIELARDLAAHLGAEPVFVRTSWPSLAADLSNGRFDVALSGIGYTPERAAVGLYSAPYHAGGKTLLARCADRERFDTPAELDRPGVRVIVNPGGTNERYVRESVHQARIIVHPDNRGVFAEIVADRADVMVTDDVEAELQARRWPGQLCRTYPGTLTRGEKRILMAPDPALQALVDEWLARVTAAGVPARELEYAMQAYVSNNAAH